MSKKKRRVPTDLVRHPRYGTTIRRSEFEVDAGTVLKSSWRYARATIFPETAIPADLRKQTPATIPCAWYVDLLETCVDCRRPFIFYAVEQRHWYEVLG